MNGGWPEVFAAGRCGPQSQNSSHLRSGLLFVGRGGSVSDNAEEREKVWGNRALKILIVTFVFPILVLVFHLLLEVPTALVALLLAHVAGNPGFWGKTLSVVALIPACWGAAVLCKRVWPASK